MRLLIARALVLAGLLACGCGCGGCRRGGGEAGESSPKAGGAAGPVAAAVATKAAGGAAAPAGGLERDRLWAAAADESADDEDLAALAVHEGAAGLAAGAAADPGRLRAALRAAPSARGYAHVPWLAETAASGVDEDARLALDALADVGARVRRAEEHEDEEELAGGCARLATLARAVDRPRARRVGAIRAARTLPCPKVELPADLDAR